MEKTWWHSETLNCELGTVTGGFFRLSPWWRSGYIPCVVKRAQMMSNWGIWGKGWQLFPVSIFSFHLVISSPMLEFCKIYDIWLGNFSQSPLELSVALWLNFGKWQMGRKKVANFQGTSLKEEGCSSSILSVSPSLWLECDMGLSGLLHSHGLELCLGMCNKRARSLSLGSLGAPLPRTLQTLSPSASFRERKETFYPDGTTLFWDLFVIVVWIYPKNSAVQVKQQETKT